MILYVSATWEQDNYRSDILSAHQNVAGEWVIHANADGVLSVETVDILYFQTDTRGVGVDL